MSYNIYIYNVYIYNPLQKQTNGPCSIAMLVFNSGVYLLLMCFISFGTLAYINNQ